VEPVISPWVFYWLGNLNVINKLVGAFFGLSVVIFVMLVMLAIHAKIEGDWDGEDYNVKLFAKTIKRVGITALFMLLLVFFIPSQSTAYKMLIAQQITVDRVEKGSQAIGKIYNDILKRVDKALDKKD
jgi:TctA family transporter